MHRYVHIFFTDMYVYSHATESYAGIAGFQPVAITDSSLQDGNQPGPWAHKLGLLHLITDFELFYACFLNCSMHSRDEFLLLLDSCNSGQKGSPKKQGGSMHYPGKLCNPSSISTLQS